mgnify:CR=1 FL=1
MFEANSGQHTRKRPVTLSVRADLLEEARALSLNASQAAESGIALAVRQAKEEVWRKASKAGVDAYNERIHREGTLIKPVWLKTDGAL